MQKGKLVLVQQRPKEAKKARKPRTPKQLVLPLLATGRTD
jgi:hypothetical protein